MRDRGKGYDKFEFCRGSDPGEELYRYLQERLNLPESRGENLDNIYAGSAYGSFQENTYYSRRAVERAAEGWEAIWTAF